MDMREVLFVSLALLGAVQCKFFKYETCDTEASRYIQLEQMTATPDPINLKQNVNVNMKMKVLKDIPKDAVINVRFYKIKSIFGLSFGIRLPCLIGSCSQTICDYLKKFKEQADSLFQNLNNNDCIVKEGEYTVDNAKIQIPEMSAFARYFAKGKYRVEININVGRKVTDCFKFFAQLQ